MINPYEQLRNKLRTIDGRSYRAYTDIKGHYQFPDFVLAVDHVQGDPFASPSRARVIVSPAETKFPPSLRNTRVRRVATEDFLTRQFADAIEQVVKGHRGIGHSGQISIDVGRQEVIERTACSISPSQIEFRLSIGLPAAGRTILGKEAIAMFFDEIPQVVQSAVFAKGGVPNELAVHLATVEDQESVRQQLAKRKLVAFVADGSVLPRASGATDLPLKGSHVVRFVSPPELSIEVSAPNQGPLRGMGIPEGVTIIVGGGYHGKSTVLNALARCVYCHIPGDGREHVVTRADAVKIRAEDGRSVQKVDISPFINNLPFGEKTNTFSTTNASGSTSQAANIIEALECGSRLLLLDEDTSATNFMIRDARMQRLVPKGCEPITPFIDQVRALYIERGISSIIVIGGSGDYFDVADNVIALHNYEPSIVTGEARRIAEELPSRRIKENTTSFGALTKRSVIPNSLEPFRRGRIKASARGLGAIEFGNETIDLQAVEQLIDRGQTQAIANLLIYALQRGYFDNSPLLSAVLDQVLRDIQQEGLDVISPSLEGHPGDYALPRIYETAAALNRLRTLRIQASTSSQTV